MRVLLWHEKNPTSGGAESWLHDLGKGLAARGHAVAWLWSDQIERAVAEFRPDVVTIGTIHNFIGLEPAAWLADQGIPGVWFLHDYWPFCGPRMLMRNHNQSDQPCEAVSGVCQNSCGGSRPVPAVLGRFYVVTGCQGAADILRRHGVRVDAVVEEAVDTELFQPEPEARVARSIYASAAWNAPWKGMHVLQQAVSV
jgi:hypothetical protein